DVTEHGYVESAPKQDGRNMLMVLGPTKKKTEAKMDQVADRDRRMAQRKEAQEAERAAEAELRAAHAAEAASKKKRGPADNMDPEIDL
ncbi:MAG TPA: translation initiation factor IF-3, partial [Tessaracoccus flavescens]|nr:translation initiation factor IF-3 [Tessaracoccus flavescens]